MRARRRSLLIILLFSALALLVFSTSSPLYPTNPWLDANCYMTVGRAMGAGKVPYRDLVEQKGPLTYALHLAASKIPSAGGFFGTYLLEVAALALFLTASLRTILLYRDSERFALPLLLALALLMLSSNAFGYGDSCEELCLPLMAWSMYDALRCIREGGEPGPACLLRNGILAGCVLWTKYSLLGVHFAWMAFFAIDALVRGRSFPRALRMCLIFLAGMALTALPWLLYFGANGALPDFLRGYFVDNLTRYHVRENLFVGIAICFGAAVYYNAVMLLFDAVGVVEMFRSQRFGRRERLCVLGMMASTLVFTAMPGRRFFYMFYVWALFAPLGLLPALRLLDRAAARGARFARAVVAGAAACALIASLAGGNMISQIGYPREELVQEKFADVIREREHPTMLNCGFLDGGFYRAAGVIPSERWFCSLNVNREECFRTQKDSIERGAPDYVVMRGVELDEYGISGDKYELVMRSEDAYNTFEGRIVYYLYRRRGLR